MTNSPFDIVFSVGERSTTCKTLFTFTDRPKQVLQTMQYTWYENKT